MAVEATAPDLNRHLQEELTCSLCLEIFNSPVLITKCSHNFCKKCISQHCQKTRTKTFCPECRGELCPSGLIDNRSLANIVDIFHRMKKTQRTWARKPEQRWEQLDFWTEDKKAKGSAGLLHGLKEVIKISELPQQIEAVLKAIACWKKSDTEMKEHVSQIKRLVAEAFSFLKNDINDTEKMVLNIIDKEYMAAQQKRDLIDHQLKARNEQLLELELNSEVVIKNTSLEQEVCFSNPIEMTDVICAVQKIKSITYAVEEFRRQLETSVLWSYPVQLPQAPRQGLSQEASSCSSAVPSVTDDDSIPRANSFTSGTLQDDLRCEERSNRSGTGRAEPVISSQFSQWASNVTFDLQTLNSRLELSEDQKVVSVSKFPSSGKRSARMFRSSQALGCQGFLDGCHYWEVITRDAAGWAVGVAHEGIGSKDKLGRTELSWCVEWSDSRLSAWHGGREIHISNEKPVRVGVFLNIPEGCVSFYSLANQETFLHEFEIRVVKPVYPAFWIFGGNTGESLKINDIRKCGGTSPL